MVFIIEKTHLQYGSYISLDRIESLFSFSDGSTQSKPPDPSSQTPWKWKLIKGEEVNFETSNMTKGEWSELLKVFPDLKR